MPDPKIKEAWEAIRPVPGRPGPEAAEARRSIKLEKVSCGYGSREVVSQFSAAVAAGDVFCLLGPNGIGKTTLFKTILGLLPSRGGHLSLDGRDLTRMSAQERARLIGYVPQAHVPPFAFSVFDVVLMGRTAHLGTFGRPGRRDRRAAEDSLERLGIGFLRDRVYTQLSGGERQMVLIARALTQEPAFLMMDEPTSNLDFGNQARVLQNIRRLAGEGLGVIITTHFPDHVFQCGNRVALMRPGRPHLVGEVDEVMTEENLQSAYGVPVAIVAAADGDQSLHFCQARLA